jgi:peptide/nickel transport system substrate-binding protein
MRLSGWRWLALSSACLCAVAALAETRPQYGSVLKTATRITPMSLDPADRSQDDTMAKRNLTRLMFDTLVTMDEHGRLQPALAISWQSASGNQRWQFWLRPHVKFHDGTPVTPEAVAAALRAANNDWTVVPAVDSVIIERNNPDADLAAAVARPRNAISKRSEGGTLIGTGPFHLKEWQPGKKLVLAADEGYWGGRPFLDGIEIDFGQGSREQLIAFDLAKIDVAELAPEQARRASTEGRRVGTSAPIELLALVFARERQTPEEGKLREALALSIDRNSIRSAVLQGVGEPNGGILPGWVSGYAFVFPAEQNLERARQLRGEVKQPPAWTLGYDANDALSRLIAERIALNARDAGLSVQAVTTAHTDLRVQRMTLASLNPRVALSAVASSIGLTAPNVQGDAVEDVYQMESAMLQSQRLLPLLQLPVSYALGSTVKDWSQGRDGSEHLENVWVGGRP